MEDIKVAVISFTPNMLDVLLGEEFGFYRAQGLKIEWLTLAGDKAIQALLAAEVDFAIQIAPAVKRIMLEGVALKVVLTIHRDPPHWMMARPGMGGVEALKGKTVGAGGKGSDSSLLVENWLKKTGLEPGRDVRITYHGAQPEWARGWVRMTDDVPMAIPLEREILEARGWSPLVELTTVFPGLLNHGLVVTETTIEDRPQIIRSMVKAHQGVVGFINGRSAEVTDFMQKRWQVDPETASKSLAHLSRVFCADLKAEDLRAVLAVTAEKLGRPPLNPEEVMDARFLIG